MSTLSDLLNKAPQSVKDKYKMKIREKAIEKVKEKIVKDHGSISNYFHKKVDEDFRLGSNGKVVRKVNKFV